LYRFLSLRTLLSLSLLVVLQQTVSKCSFLMLHNFTLYANMRECEKSPISLTLLFTSSFNTTPYYESQRCSIDMEASSSSCETRQAPSTSSSSDSHAHHLPSSAEPRQQPLDKMGQDEVMTDDMKLAISALGLLRSEGGGGASSHPPTPHHSQTSQFPNHSPTLSSHQYRSTSTASTSGASDQWGTNTNSSLVSGSETGTGTSSPLTTTSIAHSDQGDYFKRPGIEGEYELEEGNEHDPKFIERVSQLPLVSGGLEWYERSKANSRVVKVSS